MSASLVVVAPVGKEHAITEALTIVAPDPELAATLAIAAVSGDGVTVVEEVLAVDNVDRRSFRVVLRSRTT